MSIDELETGTARGLEREILQLRALELWDAARFVEEERAVLLAPKKATSHVSVVQMQAPHGWFGMFRAWVKGARR